MSCYHSMELCFLSAVYINLLITKQPMFLHFKPYPDGFPDNSFAFRLISCHRAASSWKNVGSTTSRTMILTAMH